MHKSLIFLFSKGLILKIFWCLHCGFRLLLELNRCILGFNSIGNSYSIDGVLIPFMEFLQFILLGNCTETSVGAIYHWRGYWLGGWGFCFCTVSAVGGRLYLETLVCDRRDFHPNLAKIIHDQIMFKLSGRFLVNTLVI